VIFDAPPSLLHGARPGSWGKDTLEHPDERDRAGWRSLVIAASLVLDVAAAALVVVGAVPAVLLVAVVVLSPVAAVLLLGLVERPQRGILVLAALIPFHGLHDILPIPPAWKEALVLLTLAATFVAPMSARGAQGRRLPDWVLPLAVFIGLAVVSAGVIGGTRALVGLKIGFFYVLVAVAVWLCPLSARERDGLVTILMVTGVLTALYGIAQQYIGDVRLNELGYSYAGPLRTAGGRLRSFSTFDQNFQFSLFLMLVLIVGAAVVAAEPRRLRSRLFLVSLPILLAGLVSSITRTAWVGLAAALVYLAVVRFRSLFTSLVHAALIGLVALLLAAGYTSVFLSTQSTQERFDIWRTHIAEVGRNPLGLGIGATGSSAVTTREIEDDGDELTRYSGVIEPDNYYFKTVLELGVLGLWMFLLFLLSAFLAVQRAGTRLPGVDGALALGVAASIVAAVVVAVTSSYFEVFPMDFFFWLLLAVVTTYTAPARASEPG
jgi:putative inorganic carbon (HCO3(-)) transporter